MVAHRTTLLSVSTFAILLALNTPEKNVINLLWTGVDVDFIHVKWGLFFYLVVFSVSYAWRWRIENAEGYTSAPKKMEDVDKEIKKLDRHIHGRLLPEVSQHLEQDEKETISKISDALKTIHNMLMFNYRVTTTSSKRHNIIFNLLLPLGLPVIAVYSLLPM